VLSFIDTSALLKENLDLGDKFSFRGDVGKFVEKILSWNSDVVERQLGIVHTIHAHLQIKIR
jgi:hypothetical protein